MERIGLIRVNHGDECWVGAEIDFISGPGDHTTNSGGMSDLAHNIGEGHGYGVGRQGPEAQRRCRTAYLDSC